MTDLLPRILFYTQDLADVVLKYNILIAQWWNQNSLFFQNHKFTIINIEMNPEISKIFTSRMHLFSTRWIIRFYD